MVLNNLRKTLLVSSYAPPSLAGAPQVMYKLLKTLPPEFYTIVTSFYNIDNTSAKMGSWLPGEYVFYDNPKASKEIRRHNETKPEETPNNPIVRLKKTLRESFVLTAWVKAPLSAVVKNDITIKLKRFLKRNAFFKTLLGAPLILGQIPLIIRQGVKSVKKENIDLMVGFSDYGPALVGTYYIHKQTKVPFCLYMFDIYEGNLLPLTGQILAKIFEPKLFKCATKIIVNNEGTKEFYRRRYGNGILDKIEIIYNSTNPKPYLDAQTPMVEHSPPYTILFAGNIYWAQLSSVKNLIKAIEGMDDVDIRFQIYSTNPPEYFKAIGIDSSKIDFNVAPNSEMPHIQSKTDILFLPLAWNTKSPAIINTATPGKLTDYLIAGRPILVHAPPESHLVQYAKDNNFALVVDEENIEKLQKAIRKLLFNKDTGQQYIDNAQKVFFQNHDGQKNIDIFQSLLSR